MSFELQANKTSHYGVDEAPIAEDSHIPPMKGVSEANDFFMRIILSAISALAVLAFFPLSLLFCVIIVQEYERVVVFRLGRIHHGRSGPGMLFVLPCIEKHILVDMRTFTASVPRQNVLTKDLVTITIDAVIYYHIFNATLSETVVTKPHQSTELLSQTILRSAIGRHTYSDLLASRQAVSEYIQKTLDDVTDAWGIKIERVDIKEFRLPSNLQRSMAAEAEACREANAMVVTAEGELNASTALKHAAEVMSQCPASIQLRCLQTLSTVAANDNSTITFPLPIDLLFDLFDDVESKPSNNELFYDI